jgi:DNA-binding HxlR family transcriptional regulator
MLYNALVRSYGQYCSVAKALDLIGDRWNLLIVRELLLRGPCRYTDLVQGLPGIASNMLTDRLRDLERGGVVSREQAPPPVASTLFGLTDRGQALRPILRALGEWGAQLMGEPAAGDEFRNHWLALPVQLYLADPPPQDRPVTIELQTGEEPVTIETVDGAVRTRQGAAADPDLVLNGPPHLLVGVLSGRLSVSEARARGLSCRGDAATLRRLQARPQAALAG